MLAHTTSRHIIIATQLAIGVMLLSASYFTDNNLNADSQMKANAEQTPEMTELTTKQKHC